MNAAQSLAETISALFARVSTTNTITQRDRQLLMKALVHYSINEEERQAIDRLLYAVRLGRIKLVDQL